MSKDSDGLACNKSFNGGCHFIRHFEHREMAASLQPLHMEPRMRSGEGLLRIQERLIGGLSVEVEY